MLTPIRCPTPKVTGAERTEKLSWKKAPGSTEKKNAFCRAGRSGQQDADQRQDAPAEKIDQGVQGAKIQQADDDKETVGLQAKE